MRWFVCAVWRCACGRGQPPLFLCATKDRGHAANSLLGRPRLAGALNHDPDAAASTALHAASTYMAAVSARSMFSPSETRQIRRLAAAEPVGLWSSPPAPPSPSPGSTSASTSPGAHPPSGPTTSAISTLAAEEGARRACKQLSRGTVATDLDVERAGCALQFYHRVAVAAVWCCR